MEKGRNTDRTVAFVFLSSSLFLLAALWAYWRTEATEYQGAVLRIVVAVLSGFFGTSLSSIAGEIARFRHRTTFAITGGVAVVVLTYSLSSIWTLPVEKLALFASDHRASLIAIGLGVAGVIAGIAGLSSTILFAAAKARSPKITISIGGGTGSRLKIQFDSSDPNAAERILHAMEQQIATPPTDPEITDAGGES